METVFEARELGKFYPETVTRALDGVNLSLSEGSIVGLIGPNGSGKSTLLLHMTGQCLPTEGECFTFGRPSAQLGSEELNRLGAVHQNDRFVPQMTVRQQLLYVGSFYERWDKELESELVGEAGLDPGSRVFHLSPGNAQKLSIILAVCHRPSLLLLDEPASALDPLSREAFFRLLFDLIAGGDTTIVISSHMLSDLERIVDHVVCLNSGRVCVDRPLDEIRDEYSEWWVTAPRELPASFDEPFVVSQRLEAKQARLIVRGADIDPDAFSRLHDLTVVARPLALHELYPLLVSTP